MLDACEGKTGKQREEWFELMGAERGVTASTVRSKYYTLLKPKKRTAARWSKRAQKEMVREVSTVSGRQRTAVFEQWAQRRGVKVSAIKAKYYKLAPGPASNGSTPPVAEVEPAPKVKAVAKTTPVAVVARPAADPAEQRLTSLNMLELAQLGRRVSTEIERRIESVQSLWA